MSQQNDFFDDDDDLEAEDLGVARHEHAAGHLSSGSRFSRAGTPRKAQPVSQPRPAAARHQAAPQPAPEDVFERDVVFPEVPQAPVRQAPAPQPAQPQPRGYVDPDANRAAFDAQYEESAAGQTEQRPLQRWLGRKGSAQAQPDLQRPQAAGEGAVRAPRAPRKRRHHRVLRVLLVLVVAIVVAYMAVCVPIDRKIGFEGDEAKAVDAALTPHNNPLDPYYVLLLGSDAREGDTVSRTDSMILTRVDVTKNQITMISIPRDTKVDIAGHGTQKINAAYAFDGVSGAIKATEQLTGVKVNETAIVHFDGIASLVDAVGGITVDVPVEVNDPNYTGLVLSTGPQQMDGETALLFSRVRHGFALGDYQRQIDQQLVIQAIIEKARSLPPTELPRVAGDMGTLLDTSMRCYDAIPLFVRMLGGSPTIYQVSIPSTTDTIDGVSYVIADENALANMMDVVEAGGDPTTVANGLE